MFHLSNKLRRIKYLDHTFYHECITFGRVSGKLLLRPVFKYHPKDPAIVNAVKNMFDYYSCVLPDSNQNCTETLFKK